MSDRGIIDTFHILGCLRLPELSIKILGIMLIGKNKVLEQTLCGGSAPDLVPENNVSFHVA